MTSEDVCMICLETDPDTPAPCQPSQPPLLFHDRCLCMTWASQSEQPRCPHCNEAVVLAKVIDHDSLSMLALHRLTGLLQKWFRDPGLWKQKSQFIKTKNGLLTEEENVKVLHSMQKEVMSAMHSNSIVGPDDDETTWSYISDNSSTEMKTTVWLTRTAMVDTMGRFLQDGYSVVAARQPL